MRRFDKLFINGSWVYPHGNRFSPVIDPATEEVIAEICNATAEDVDEAFRAAKQAFGAWSQTTSRERHDWIVKIHDALQSRREELANIISASMGCPINITRQIQTSCIDAFRNFAARSAILDETTEVDNVLVIREPVGVCALITPWNYPLFQLLTKVGSALAAGCTVVVKESSVTPLQGLVLAEVIDSIGLPDGVFNLLTGKGSVLGDLMVTHPAADMVSFTGSTVTGARIQELSARSIKRVCLELGGKSPFIITESADLEAAIRFGVEDVMINSGQTCVCLSRMLIPRSRYEEAVVIAKTIAERIRIGNPADEATYMGPMSTRYQRGVVIDYIQKGLDEGARLVTGGPDLPEGVDKGAFVRPTIFRDVHNKMTIAQEEIFGPVLCMISYDRLEEAILMANDSPYGLASAVWSGTLEDAIGISRRIRAGACSINGGEFSYEAPLGGYKQSGNGRECGDFGMHEFIELKSLQLPAHARRSSNKT
ncbi:aldehyde dehydrogenase family protein [Burkholderia sp. D-99]|uniref:aldehyde dehydrogenase family protein n=1 Tax=Burkholderia sp. D-99 TaxID=2717316 RepID=UPI00141E5A7C|nr:aldehyde dehydrogenase family protein [Burkholderia sp. D-99]